MMKKTAKQLTFYIILTLLGLHMASAVEIKTTLDRNPVAINESFQLTFTATESPDDDPDFSPLQQDFDIINQTQSRNSSWVNGKSTQSIQWIVNLMAKKTGILNIPAIAFGDDTSQPITVEVKQKLSASIDNNADLFLKVEVSTNKVYVQSQVIYTLRFYRKVQLTQASLNEPSLPDAVIEKLGEDKTYDTVIKGVTYIVTERKYAIFPQKSGQARIAPLLLTAELISNGRRRFNSFFSRSNTITKRIASKAIDLEVLPVPDNFHEQNWIPAEQVYLEQKWSGDINDMTAGEPLTRTLTLLAKGTTVAQLPELHNNTDIKNLKSYPDQPVLKEQKKSDGVIAFREEKIAYIPSKAGHYKLPAIEIPWFNVRTNKMEIARIPETTLQATAAASTQGIATAEIKPASQQAAPVKQAETLSRQQNSYFWIGLSIFLACGWLLTGIALIKRMKPKTSEKPEDDSQEIALKQVIKNLKQACNNNEPVAAKNALLAWGKLKFNATNLADIATRCESRLRDEIYYLNKILYSKQTEPWQGKKLYQFFSENKAREKFSTGKDDGLEPLYKI